MYSMMLNYDVAYKDSEKTSDLFVRRLSWLCLAFHSFSVHNVLYRHIVVDDSPFHLMPIL
jgi:hypothetical protein